MRHLRRGLGFMALAGGVAFAMPAAATQWLSTNATQISANEWKITVGTSTVNVWGYSTKTLSSCSTCLAPDTGTWQAANVIPYSGGFGITSTVAGDAYEGTQPEHAVDNNQVFDVLVFELPNSGFDLEAFRLGWATEAYAPSTTVTNEADIHAYFGGNDLGANYNFANACFIGCTNTGSGATAKGDLTYLGFTDLMNNGANSINGSNVPITDQSVPGTQSGRYLVMTGALDGSNDAFKVSMLQAALPSGGQTPEPGTLALLTLGLFGLVALRRRPVFA